MRIAPNWKLGEAVDGIWKQELLVYLGKLFNLNTLIETGTCDGGTLGGIYKEFSDIHTIELSEYYYNISVERFKDVSHIHLYNGNSADTLKQILEQTPNVPTLFWLDAHPSGGLTANEGDPLSEEMKAVMALRPNSLMVIDDQSNADLMNAVEAGVDFEGWEREFRFGVVFVYKKGMYNIPEFVN